MIAAITVIINAACHLEAFLDLMYSPKVEPFGLLSLYNGLECAVIRLVDVEDVAGIGLVLCKV